MHIEYGDCAHCGKRLKTAIGVVGAFNDFRAFYPGPDFCSEECAHNAIKRDQMWSRYEKETLEEMKSHESGEFTLFCVREDINTEATEDDIDFDQYKRLMELKSKIAEDCQRIRESRNIGWHLKLTDAQKDYREEWNRRMTVQLSDRQQKILVRQERERKEAEREEKQRLKEEAEEEAEEERLAEEERERERLEPAEFEVPDDLRCEHTHILAPTGSGKSVLIKALIGEHTYAVPRPGIVLIDPKGEMVDELFRWTGMHYKSNVTVIDATDTVAPPSLNLFSARPELRNQVISNLKYIFTSKNFSLSAMQSSGFTMLARLMFSIPNATLHTMLNALDDITPFQEHIAKLDDTAKRFFRVDYGNFKATRDQIKSRIYTILESRQLDLIFSAESNNVDWLDVVNNGETILVKTGLTELGREASQMFGRYIIASVASACAARGRNRKNVPVFLYVDEAQLYVDEEHTPEMLALARDTRLAVTLAHQKLAGEFPESIQNAIASNTLTKYAAGGSPEDVKRMAAMMRCDPDFIMAQKVNKKEGYVTFAAYNRRMGMDHAQTVGAGFDIKEYDTDVLSGTRLATAIRLNRLCLSDSFAFPNGKPETKTRTKPDASAIKPEPAKTKKVRDPDEWK